MKLLINQQMLYDEFKSKNYSQCKNSDILLGIAFADFHRNVIRYNVTESKWYYYDGCKWTPDEKDLVALRYVKQFISSLMNFIVIHNAEGYLTPYFRFVKRFDCQASRERFLKDARDRHSFKSEEMDLNPYLFNCLNGTYDFKSFNFRQHNPEDLLSRMSNVYYDEAAKSPECVKFFMDIMQDDEEMVEFLQKVFGYSLTGDISIEKCFIVYGKTTRNGKSTLLETITHLMGGGNGYALSTQPETFADLRRDSRQASGEIARLDGCRLLVASEPKKNMFMDSALLKKLTGGDTITARKLYQSEREFVPQFKLFFNTNYLPNITDDTVFASKRIVVILFERHFSEEEQDLTLKSRLTSVENTSGLFNWLVEGYKKYCTEGLKIPAKVERATEEYRRSNDNIQRFVSEEMIEQENGILAGSEVYANYSAWCVDNGFTSRGKSVFFDDLRGRQMLFPSGTINGKTVRNVIKGYSLVNP